MYTGIYQTMIVLSAVLVFYTLDVLFMTRFDPKRSDSRSGRSYSYTMIVAVGGPVPARAHRRACLTPILKFLTSQASKSGKPACLG